MPEVGTKRSNDEGGYGTAKLSRDVKLRILIKGHYSGALIGKGGENFKRLREQYGVRITGLSSRAEERVLQLEGNRNDCISIIKELLPSCPEAPLISQSTPAPFELNILVDTGSVGVVIGKAGAKMKEIREECGGGIKVYPECLPNSSERVVSIGGQDETVLLKMLEMVLATLDLAPPSQPTSYYDPANPVSQHELQGFSQPQNRNVSSDSVHVDIAQILMARRDSRKESSTPNDFGQIETETTLKVPHHMCGAIIGKQGANVRNIRLSSGVSRIDFSQNEMGDILNVS